VFISFLFYSQVNIRQTLIRNWFSLERLPYFSQRVAHATGREVLYNAVFVKSYCVFSYSRCFRRYTKYLRQYSCSCVHLVNTSSALIIHKKSIFIILVEKIFQPNIFSVFNKLWFTHICYTFWNFWRFSCKWIGCKKRGGSEYGSLQSFWHQIF